jgi:hypothetical protein
MFLFGGKSNGYHSDMYKLNLNTRAWKQVNQTGKAPLARYGHGASVYQVHLDLGKLKNPEMGFL